MEQTRSFRNDWPRVREFDRIITISSVNGLQVNSNCLATLLIKQVLMVSAAYLFADKGISVNTVTVVISIHHDDMSEKIT